MMPFVFVFYIFVALAVVVGAMRGWVKELLVIFSGLLGLFIIEIFSIYIGLYNSIVIANPTSAFWLQSVIMIMVAIFGYQIPKLSRLQAASRRENIRDTLLGGVLGAANGYLIFGSIWAFLDTIGYDKFGDYLMAPDPSFPMYEATVNLMEVMPPNVWWSQEPAIYIIVAIIFTIIVAVFV
jgi:hypothetical protein